MKLNKTQNNVMGFDKNVRRLRDAFKYNEEKKEQFEKFNNLDLDRFIDIQKNFIHFLSLFQSLLKRLRSKYYAFQCQSTLISKINLE